MKLLQLCLFSVISCFGYEAYYTLRLDATESLSRDSNETETITAIELSRRVCVQYAVSSDFCDSLAEAVDQAKNDYELLTLPSRFSHVEGGKMHFRTPTVQAPQLTESEIAATGPASYMEPEVAWGLQTSRDPALIMDTILGLADKYYSGFPEAVKQITLLYFDIGWNLMEELFKFEKQLGQSVWDSIWEKDHVVVDNAAGHLTFLKNLVVAGSSSSHEEFLRLLQYQQEHTDLFTPLDYFPLFTAWSALHITLYRSLMCDKTWFNKFTASEQQKITKAYQALVAHQVEVGAIAESTYNSWFLQNKRYRYAKDIRIHFELRFAFDYTIAIGAAGQKCDFVMKESIVPKSYSANPLFNYEILDTGEDRRMNLVDEFYVAAMSYSMPLKKLTALGVVWNDWDASHSFRGGYTQYSDGSKRSFGDYSSGNLSGWTLTSCKVRGMRYEFGKQSEDALTKCWEWTTRFQYYRDKECWNKFHADVECGPSKASEWTLGHEFHEPNVVIGSRKTRVFNSFVGWKTLDHDYDLTNCQYDQTYAIWVSPRGRTPLLDNLLAVYRIDSVDY